MEAERVWKPTCWRVRHLTNASSEQRATVENHTKSVLRSPLLAPTDVLPGVELTHPRQRTYGGRPLCHLGPRPLSNPGDNIPHLGTAPFGAASGWPGAGLPYRW